ncbi:MAG TPA: DUF4097 family beta strand repeat-containing protein [Bryobacteraceae bacterium]|nr:DUF4097 family beta strand repeat-containing protein [Bryobacteraceae bacterium]
MRTPLSYVLLAATLALAGCDIDLDDVSMGAKEEESFFYNYDFKPGSRLLLDNYNGPIEITSWEKPKIEISGARFANSRDRLRDFKIEISRGAESINIRTVPPLDRTGNTGARYVIRLPRQAVLELVKSTNGSLRVNGIEGAATLRTTNGAVRVSSVTGTVSATSTNGGIECIGLSGSVTARTTNGRIKLEDIAGPMEATTTNGGIVAVMTRATDDRKMRFATTNGGIELRLPDALKNDVRASTTNGSIDVKLPSSSSFQIAARTTGSSVRSEFNVQGEVTKKRIEGKVGVGGPLLDLSTSNGSISLQRAL